MANNFNLVIGSKFKPFSYSELLAPVLMADTEHRLIEEGLGELDTRSGVLEAMINLLTDPEAYALYRVYADELAKQADMLARLGLNPETRRGLLNARKLYSTSIAPIEMAANRRLELTKEQREAINKDPSLMFDVDYSVSSLKDLMNNPNATYKSISGALLSKRAGEMAKNLAKTIQSNPLYLTVLGGLYFQRMQLMGYTPLLVMLTILNDPNAPKELKQLAETVYNEAGLETWDNVTLSRARDYISSGLYEAIGAQQYDTQANRGFISQVDQAKLDMEKERFRLYEELLNKDKSTIPLGDGSHIRVIGGGKALRIYPDGRVENYVGNSGIKGVGIKEAAKVGDTPIIVANTKGEWRVGEEGLDVKKTAFGLTRSNVVSSWGNYTLDKVNPNDIVSDYNEIPKGALNAMLKAAKDLGIDLDNYEVVRVKADRSSNKYDYVLYPKRLTTPQLPIAKLPAEPALSNFNENLGL